jgi:putative membrane protein
MANADASAAEPPATGSPAEEPTSEALTDDEPTGLLAIKSTIGGVLMGLANLVPGISGGTMLLASGVYPRFIAAIAEVSTFRFKKRSLLVLGIIVLAALLSILLLAGTVKDLVVSHRWVMYSLFIGLTLGGVPVVWKLAKPATTATWIGAVIGFVPMAILAFYQAQSTEGAAEASGFVMMFLAGAAGASAMILPGVSGGYLLLVMGVYVTILSGIDDLMEALKAGDMDALMDPLFDVVVPVGLGVVVGVLIVSNVLEKLLEKFEKGTLGALIGLLIGAVVGLWPFQVGVAPALGSTFKGQLVTAELLAELEPEKYPTEYFQPGGGQAAGAVGLIVVGFALTALIAKLGAAKDEVKKGVEASADA